MKGRYAYANFLRGRWQREGTTPRWRKIAIVAPAFLADGLETLEELDIGIREHFIELGGEELTVVKCLNDNQDWIEGLHNLVQKKFSNSVPNQNNSASLSDWSTTCVIDTPL